MTVYSCACLEYTYKVLKWLETANEIIHLIETAVNVVRVVPSTKIKYSSSVIEGSSNDEIRAETRFQYCTIKCFFPQCHDGLDKLLRFEP